MKHKAFTWVEFAVVVALLIILPTTYFLFLVGGHGSGSRRSSCQSNLKQIGMGFLMYAQDYNEKFPAVAASDGWTNAVQPYVKSWQIFHCPSASSNRGEHTTDYYYNARLSGVKQGQIEALELSILMADGLSGQPADYSLMQLPAAWRTDEKSPAWRHTGTANYLFSDGHAKPLKPEKITLDKPRAGHPTFLLGRSQ